jgi:DNA-binding NarL/FixJ family response regulator
MAETREGVLIADSHRLCRGGLMSIMSTELGLPAVTGADDFAGAMVELDRDPRIGLLMVDYRLPGMGGMDGLRRIRLHRPDLRVVVMAWHQDRAEAFEALSAGAHGYVPKDLPSPEMVHALQTVLNGQIYVPSIISDVSLKGSPSMHEGSDHEGELTLRQREVLTHLAAGLSNKEIARALSIAEGTVKVHITAAFRTLHVHNRVGAAAALQKLTAGRRLGQPELPGLLNEGPPPPPKKSDLGSKFIVACLPVISEQSWLLDAAHWSIFG